MVRFDGHALDEHLLFVQYSELAVPSIGTAEQTGPIGRIGSRIPALAIARRVVSMVHTSFKLSRLCYRSTPKMRIFEPSIKFQKGRDYTVDFSAGCVIFGGG